MNWPGFKGLSTAPWESLQLHWTNSTCGMQDPQTTPGGMSVLSVCFPWCSRLPFFLSSLLMHDVTITPTNNEYFTMVLNSAQGHTNRKPHNIFLFFFLFFFFAWLLLSDGGVHTQSKVIPPSRHVGGWMTAPAGTSLAACASWDATCRLASRLILFHIAACQPAQKGLTCCHASTAGNHIHELLCPRERERFLPSH